MIYLDIAIVIFIVMELANVVILYFVPDSRLGNGVAVFNPWFSLKKNESTELFAKYMANWVAGSKLVFISLLIVIFITGDEATKLHSVLIMIFSISTYYIKLNPIIKKLDEKDELTPKGYSKVLPLLIGGILLLFTLSIILFLLF